MQSHVPSPTPATLLVRSIITTGLAPGTCQLFSQPGARGTIFVDPGHGGVDPGALGQTTSGVLLKEKDLTLAIGMELLKRLRAEGYAVLMSRTADSDVSQLGPTDTQAGGYTAAGKHKDIAARIRCANAGQAGLLIAIHFNSFAAPNAGGAETIFDSARRFSSDSRRFATLVQRQILASLAADGWSVPDRGIKDDATLDAPALTQAAASYGHLLELGPSQAGWLDQPSAMPGALTEPLFITDPNEADIAASTRGQGAIASGIAQAINLYFTGSG